MHKGTFIAGLLAALFGGILIGLLLAPFKNGVNFNNSKFNIGNHSGNGNAPSLSVFSPQSTVRKNRYGRQYCPDDGALWYLYRGLFHAGTRGTGNCQN